MRLAFMGTPAFAVPALDALVAAGQDVAAVYTQPPRPAARGKALQRSAVHVRADALGLPVRIPVNFKAGAGAASTSTPRSCPGGAARPRSSGQSSPATRRPA